MGATQQEFPVTFWDPVADSLFAVRDSKGSKVIAVFCQSRKALLASEDIGGQVIQIDNSDLPDFWFENSHLSLIR